ncbi:TonB-dependent receptor [uncultured Ilyobacter sp.]|uniref:TonB-dependent receptor family protein n=1 Tax=uncultured Ilyobacter sp. TaxID=544433 RepID=UPI0029C633E4|nr:TonB-dependent receptor [uncultured Ilyobacter sp.]
MKKKLFIGALLVCSTLALGAEEDFFQGDSVATTRLEESVITSERFETTVRNTPKNITIVTRDDIDKKGAKDVFEALEGIPGVKPSKAFGLGFIELRGTDGVVVLVDGVRQNPVDGGTTRVSTISIENIERIEVIPGGGSVMYGDGVIGGVINIITRTSATSEGYRSIFSEAGNNGLFNYGVSYGDKITDNLLLQLNYTDNNYDGYRDNGFHDTENIEVGVKYLMSDTEALSFKYGNYTEGYGAPGGITKAQLDTDRNQATSAAAEKYEGEYEDDSYTLSYNKKLSENIEFIIDGNYRETDLGSELGWGAYEYELSNHSVKPKLKLGYGENSHIVLGYDYYFGEAEVSKWGGAGEVGRDLEKTSDSFFAINTFNWDKFQFTQGIRYEKSSYDLTADQTLEPGKTYNEDTQYNTAIDLSVNYLYSDTGSAFISYTSGFRTPNTDELASAPDEGLKEQTHDYIELGVKDTIFNSFVSASVYKFVAQNEIYWDKSINYPFGGYNNYDGETDKIGAEVFAEQYIGKFTFKETFTYLDAEMDVEQSDGSFEKKEIPGVSKYVCSLGADYQATDKLLLSTTANYRGNSYAYGDSDNDGEKVDSYITLDAKISYDFKNGLKIYGGVNNIFNEEYNDYVYYNAVYAAYSPGKYPSYYPAPERNYYLGFKYNF